MPIEVRELVVRVTIDDETPAAKPAKRSQESSGERVAREIRESVLDSLREKEER